MKRHLPRFAFALAPLALFALAAGGSACGSDETGGGGAGGMGAGGMAAGGSGGQAGGAGGGGAKPADEHVVVLFTSDEHSHLFAFSPELDDFPISTQKGTGKLVGGVARRAAVIAKERRAAKDAGKDSILVSAGDNQMGCLPHTVFETESVDYTTMKALGYDVTTFGNHEFDFGPKALATSIQAAQQHGGLPPIVASNIHFSTSSPDDDTLAALYSKNVGDAAPVHPYRVITLKGGKKIGVLGYVGVNASHVAPNKTPVAFSELGVDPSMQADTSVVWPHLDADLQPIVDTLRNKEKVDLVIALSHGGINDTSSEAGIEAGDDWNVCRNVSGIDFIVSGHAHNADPKPIEVTNAKTKKGCLVLNGSAFGQHLGRVEFTIPGGGGDVTWDKSTQALIPIDDTTLPDATEAQAVPGIVESIENGAYLPSLLSRVTGTTVTNSTSTPGDLYFHPVGHTDFDVTDTHALLFLSADAMLAAADAWGVTSGKATQVALESAGVIRAVLKKGETGAISAADAFNVVPLGSSPTGDGSIGYPLVRANVFLLELRGVFELALAQGAMNSDLDIGMSGMKVEYDATRPTATTEQELLDPTKGQVMRILVDTNHADGYEQFDTVLYDRTQGVGNNTQLVSVITSSYIAQFAGDAGVTLKDDAGNPVDADKTQAVIKSVLHRSDASEIKQLESFLGWIYAAPGGTLPDVYDKASPNATQRWVCTNGC